MERLQPLADVEEDDLTTFFKDGHTSCPQHLIYEMPALIWQNTEGNFNKTVSLIEDAEEGGAKGWMALHQTLLKNATPPE